MLLGFVCEALCTGGLSGARVARASGHTGARRFYRSVVKYNSFWAKMAGAL